MQFSNSPLGSYIIYGWSLIELFASSVGQHPRAVDHQLSRLGLGEAPIVVLVEQLERGQLEVCGGSSVTDKGCQSNYGQECLHFVNESVSLPKKQLRGERDRRGAEDTMFDPDLNWIDTTTGLRASKSTTLREMHSLITISDG